MRIIYCTGIQKGTVLKPCKSNPVLYKHPPGEGDYGGVYASLKC